VAAQLAPCADGKSLCMPDPIVRGGGQYVPMPCRTSLLNGPGACLSTCLPLVAGNSATGFLAQDGCATGELCFPCINPLDGQSTGACELNKVFCSGGDAGDAGGDADGGGIKCPYDGPPLIDPAQFAPCSPACAGSHCIPSDLVPPDQRSLLRSCSAGDGSPGLCAPDPIIASANNFVPKTCKSIAGAEGRCVSTCLPGVAAKAALLPTDVCAANEKCAPCSDPTASDPMLPTGACTLACDMPKNPPLILTCPWTGPAVVDPNSFPACSPACGGAHCVPVDLVPADQRSKLATCPTGLCLPDPVISTANHFVPPTCTSIAGAEGRCVSTCLPDIAAKAKFLPQSTCAAGTVCAPCYDPSSATPTAPTGACSLGCDAPKQPPLILTCPWNGPPVLDPATLPACSPSCAGSHCLPAELVPPGQRSLLASCPGGYCTPDPIIASADHWKPASCTSIAGAEGRCMSTCLPGIAAKAKLLPQSTCAAGTVCAPCFDPTSATPTAPTGACSLGCDAPAQPPVILTCPWTGPPVLDPATLPDCSPFCAGSHCLPAELVPPDQRGLLASCPGGYCAPDPIIASDDHWKPASCTSVAGAEGRCLSICLPSIYAQTLMPRDICPARTKCAPCYDPTSSTPTAPTGACSIGCDVPTRPPVTLTCPWTGPPVIDANVLPACDTACAGAHCLPNAYVPQGQASQLATCGSAASAGRCTPDDLIASAGKVDPENCIAFAGTSVPGRCLSPCLPAVAAQPTLETSTCSMGRKCVPCNDPISGASTGACGTIGCDEAGPTNPFKFPTCCGGTGTCVPRSQIPDNKEGSLDRRDCPATTPDVYLCAPTDQLPGNTPQACHVSASILPPFSWDNVCVPDCIIGGSATFIPRDGCPANWSCPPP
jgi:hypothetical protein